MKSKRARDAAQDSHTHTPVTAEAKKRKRSGRDEAVEATKHKKAKREKKESRKERKDRRKDLQDLPDNDDGGTAIAGEEKNGENEEEEVQSQSRRDMDEGRRGADADKLTEKKLTEKKLTEKKKKQKQKKSESKTESHGDNDDDDDDDDGRGDAEGTTKPLNKTRQDRHIVFVGNLPYSATQASIQAHFASLKPTAVRCLQTKSDEKPSCRGIAFVEFANVWTMRTCLDKFHHTLFEDGVSAPRKINVELTAGGGGKTTFRKEKIRQKNQKLDENRSKRLQRETLAKAAAGAKKQTGHQDASHAGIHPSRLANHL